ncbi:MAG: hypothetical protein QNK37_18835 [Acidobacteriota bacterium]|nr:hypothetical protein [Acidobacteriota bacterium]
MKKALLLLAMLSVPSLTALQLYAAPTLQECRDYCAPEYSNCLVYGGQDPDCRIAYYQCVLDCLEGN